MTSFSLNISALSGIQEKTEKLRFMLILLLVFSFPFNIFYSSIIMIILSVTTVIDLNKAKIRTIPKQVWLFQLIYALGVAGYFYSFNRSGAGFLLERQLNILLFPLILPLAITIDRKKIQLILAALTISCIVTINYLFLNMFYSIHGNIKLSFIFSGAFFNHKFSRPIGIHAGYLSLYVSLSIFYLIQLYNKDSSVSKWVLTIGLVILFAGLFFLASRNAIIATFFVLIFISPLYNSKNKFRYVVISLACFTICFFAVKNVPYLRERFSVELMTDIKPLQDGSFYNYGSAEPRIERWKGALELIKRSPVLGYGTGDEIPMLKTQYIKRNLFISYLEDFNAHNQYLSYLIKNGFLGFGVFLFAFYYYCRLAVLKKDFMYLSFLLLLLIGFYTENILDANKGIIFFAFFNTIFGYNALNALKRKEE
jgi:O-antigen ligase